MEYPIGIEMTEGYLSYEVQGAAMKLVRDVMLVKEKHLKSRHCRWQTPWQQRMYGLSLHITV